MTYHNAQHEIAAEYLAADLSVISVRMDRSKSPAVDSWKEYQTRLPTPDELSRWFSRPAGIALITGKVSRGLEVLDFDQWETFEPWRHLTTGIVERLPIVETAGGGYHVLYRCRQIAGNTKIASWEPTLSPICKRDGTREFCGGLPIKPTRIETRGEGGYVVAVGSPAAVHQSGRPYAQVLGTPLPEIPEITPEERKTLWQAAAEFDCSNRASAKVAKAKREIKRALYEYLPKDRPAGDVTPWDDFDRRGSWAEILEPHGWTQAGGDKWRRPGKDIGISASVGVNRDGLEILTVFTSSDHVLGCGSPGAFANYGKFRAYAALNHGGNGSEAAKELFKLGYGSRQEVAA